MKKAAIKKAAGLTAAKKNTQHRRAYQKATPLSRNNLKLQIGELLLFGNEQRREFWWLFEVLLVRYVQDVSGKPRLTNSGQRVSE